MKKIISLLAVFLIIHAHAQTINSVTVFPSNPTTNDNILILATCTFPDGSCDQHTQGHSVAGNNIGAWAFHCIGMLTVICSYTDTFYVGLLPAGSYTIDFHLETGYGPLPCTPGIVPGPNANATFTVSTSTAVSDAELIGNSFDIYPNPVTNQLAISNLEFAIERIEIYDALSQKVYESRISDFTSHISIDVSELTPGIYFLRVANENVQRIIKIIKM